MYITMQLLSRIEEVEQEQEKEAEQQRVHNAHYWIEKFMISATQQKDPELAGHNKEASPLASVAAARWRQTLKDVQQAKQESQAEVERLRAQEEAEHKARTQGLLPVLRTSEFCTPCSCVGAIFCGSAYLSLGLRIARQTLHGQHVDPSHKL
jgi:hypothetical protein